MTNTNNPQWLDDAIIDINKKGPVRRIDESGNSSVEYMEVVKEGKSVSDRVKALMEEGMSEDDAKKNAVREVTDRMDGKLEFPDMESYIRFVADFDKTDKVRGGELSFTEQELKDVVTNVPQLSDFVNELLSKMKSPGSVVQCKYNNSNNNNVLLDMDGYLYKSKDGTYKFLPNPVFNFNDPNDGDHNLRFQRNSLSNFFRGNLRLARRAELAWPKGFNVMNISSSTNLNWLIRDAVSMKNSAKATQRAKKNEAEFDF